MSAALRQAVAFLVNPLQHPGFHGWKLKLNKKFNTDGILKRKYQIFFRNGSSLPGEILLYPMVFHAGNADTYEDIHNQLTTVYSDH
jgi:hypothetical protein